MQFTAKSARIPGTLAIIAAVALIASAADAHSLRGANHGRGAYARSAPFGPAYDAYRGGAEHYNGSSVPYDADGPGYNDFQLQGR